MIAVIFELWAPEDRRQRYFDIAQALGAELSEVEGFVSVERFRSTVDPDKYLSLSFWRDEEAVKRWRNRTSHRAAQAKGREAVFSNYRLRIAAVVRDYGMAERGQAPADSRAVHDTE